MKTPRAISSKPGFTVLELLVAMSITTIIVTVLVSVTSIAVDTWNRSRSELRASRQAKAMIDTMARDFEALVYRHGNEFEWLIAENQKPTQSTNAAKLIFLTAATDRYNGGIGTSADLGGDVSCVGYLLDYKDPTDSGGSNTYNTFVLNRLLVDPKPTFDSLLGQTNLDTAFNTYQTDLEKPENFVCENIYQFTLSFHVEVTQTSGTTTTTTTEVVTLGQGSGSTTSSFKLNGTGIVTPYAGSGSVTSAQLQAGRLKAVEISLTVLSDAGVDQLRRRGSFTGTQQAEFLAKNSYQYSKLVQVPAN